MHVMVYRMRDLRAAGLQPVYEGELVVVAVVEEEEPAEPTGWDRLSDRERAVARLAGKGLTNQQIARRLGITIHTVNFHLRQVFRKLAINSRVRLAAYRDG